MKKVKNGLFAVFCLCLIIGCRPEKNGTFLQDSQNRTQKIDSLFKSRHEQDLFHGGVVITHKGETLYENYLGIADRSWNIPIQQSIKFDIASLDKAMLINIKNGKYIISFLSNVGNRTQEMELAQQIVKLLIQ